MTELKVFPIHPRFRNWGILGKGLIKEFKTREDLKMKKTRKRYPINFRNPDFYMKRFLRGKKKSDMKKSNINNCSIPLLSRAGQVVDMSIFSGDSNDLNYDRELTIKNGIQSK